MFDMPSKERLMSLDDKKLNEARISKKKDKMTIILIDSFICLPETRCCKNENDREFMSSSYSNALLYDAGWNYSKGA
jgi:hypothetical protein